MFTTNRLFIKSLSHSDNAFILELINTPGWLKFIGDRDVHTTLDTQNYIQNILDNTLYSYWVVYRTEDRTPIGLVSLIKRDYLEHHDIGFAFLPAYNGLGYAYEASSEIIRSIQEKGSYETLYATSLPDNKSSIKLLGRLGFSFVKIIDVKEEVLDLYCLSLNQ